MATSLGRLVRTVALAFAVLFTAASAAQYWFLNHQLQEETREDLLDSAKEVTDAADYKGSWELSGYRRTSDVSGSYIFQSASGTLIDTVDFVPGLVPSVSIPFPYQADQPFTAKSDVGESWLLDVHPVTDGLVVLGSREGDLPSDAEARLRATAKQFGTTLKEALATKERGIDEMIEFAVLDSNWNLLSSRSELPLKAHAPVMPTGPAFQPVREINEKKFAVLDDPILDTVGRPVGLVTVFEDVTSQHSVLSQVARFNIAVSSVVWLVAISLLSLYVRRIYGSQLSCAQIVGVDESDRVEFKASLRWDYGQKAATKNIEFQVIKAVAAFMNSASGGSVVIGLSDQKHVVGLELDYATLKRKDRDGFQQILQAILVDAFGERRAASRVKVSFCSIEGKDLCLLNVLPAREPVLVEEAGGKMTMYVRIGNTSRALNMREAFAYASERWSGLSLRWPWRKPSFGVG